MLNRAFLRAFGLLAAGLMVASLTPHAEAELTAGYLRGGGSVVGDYSPHASSLRIEASGTVRARIDCAVACLGSVRYEISGPDPSTGTTIRVSTSGIFFGTLVFGVDAEGRDTARTDGILLGFTNESPFFFASFFRLIATENDSHIGFGRKFEWFDGEIETGGFAIHDASFL